MKPDLREAFFWAAAARNNARIRPRGELTLEKVSRLAQMIRERLPYQTASKAGCRHEADRHKAFASSGRPQQDRGWPCLCRATEHFVPETRT